MNIVVLVILSVILIALFGLWQGIRARARALKLARKHRDDFYRRAMMLVDNPRVPNNIVGILLMFSAVMAWRQGPRAVYWTMRHTSEPNQEVRAQFDALPKDIKLEVREAVISAACAMSHQSLFYGPLLRRRLPVKHRHNDKKKNGPSNSQGAAKLLLQSVTQIRVPA